MEFVPPDTNTMRRSKCGRYIIEKEVGEDGKARYCVWVFVKTIYGFNSGQEAADEATSLEAQAVSAWQALGASVPATEVAAAIPSPDSPPAASASG